jgi:hypothetical protein
MHASKYIVIHRVVTLPAEGDSNPGLPLLQSSLRTRLLKVNFTLMWNAGCLYLSNTAAQDTYPLLTGSSSMWIIAYFGGTFCV